MRRNPIFWAMMLNACLVLFASICLAVVDRKEQPQAVARTPPLPFAIERWKADFESDSQERREAAHARARGNMRALREYLREQAADDVRRQGAFSSTRGLALDLLKPASEQEDMDVLIRKITYHQPGIRLDFNPLDGYPAALALVRYGPTAAYRILEYLRTEPVENVSDRAMYLHALVFAAVFHRTIFDDQESVRMVEAAIAKHPESENYERLLAELTKVGAMYNPQRSR